MLLAALFSAASLVRLAWFDVGGAGHGAYDPAWREAAAVLEGAGVLTRWRRANPSDTLESGEIAVVALPGAAPRSREGRRVLGSTQKGAPAVWIYPRDVQWAVGLSERPSTQWSPGQRIDFGRALGRVAAHELVHLLLPDRDHSEDGLMAATLDGLDLAVPSLSIDKGTREALAHRPSPDVPTSQASARVAQRRPQNADPFILPQ